MAKKRNPKNNINSNTDIQPLSKTRTWRDFLEKDSFLMFPDKLEWRKRFCYTLVTWAQDENSLDLVQFVVEMKMGRQTLYDWANTFPDIKEALDYARLILGCRKRNGALTRKYEKDVAYRDMHKLDPEYLEINKYYADLKKTEEIQPTTFVVNLGKPEVSKPENMERETHEVVAEDNSSKL